MEMALLNCSETTGPSTTTTLETLTTFVRSIKFPSRRVGGVHEDADFAIHSQLLFILCSYYTKTPQSGS